MKGQSILSHSAERSCDLSGSFTPVQIDLRGQGKVLPGQLPDHVILGYRIPAMKPKKIHK